MVGRKIHTPRQIAEAIAEHSDGKIRYVDGTIIRMTDDTKTYDVEALIEERIHPCGLGCTSSVHACIFVTPHEDDFFDTPVCLRIFSVEPDAEYVILGTDDEYISEEQAYDQFVEQIEDLLNLIYDREHPIE